MIPQPPVGNIFLLENVSDLSRISIPQTLERFFLRGGRKMFIIHRQTQVHHLVTYSNS